MQNPNEGGSYQRDPVTGELTQLHQTQPAEPELQSAATPTDAPAADAGASPEA